MSRTRTWRTLARYAALQSPGWGLAAVVAYALVAKDWMRAEVAAGLWALWVVKDVALFPWLRHAYEYSDPDPGAALRGRIGTARERLAPNGYVRVGSELWRAELAPGCAPVEAGAPVRILEVRGLTLRVEPAPDAPS